MRALESLDVWTVGRELAVNASQLTFQPGLARHFALLDQIRRAALSVPANIAEGYALGTRPQLVRHLRIALGSTAELRSPLGIACRLELAPHEACMHAVGLCDRETALLAGFLRRLRAEVRS